MNRSTSIVSFLCILFVALPAAAQTSLVTSASFARAVDLRHSTRTAAGAELARAPIDVGVVVSVIRDRATQLASRAVGDAIARAGGPSSDAVCVRDPLTRAVAIVSDPSGVGRVQLERFGAAIVRAMVAAAAVDGSFPGAAITDPARWQARDQAAGAGVAWRPTPGTTPGSTLRLYLMDWTYWSLARHGFLHAADVTAPRCPGAFESSPDRALCTSLEGLAAPARDTAIDKLVGLAPLLFGVDLAAAIERGNRPTANHEPPQVDVRALVTAAAGVTSLGVFGPATPGLDLTALAALGPTLTQRARDLQGLPSFGYPPAGTSPESAAAARAATRAQAAALVSALTPTVTSALGWSAADARIVTDFLTAIGAQQAGADLPAQTPEFRVAIARLAAARAAVAHLERDAAAVAGAIMAIEHTLGAEHDLARLPFDVAPALTAAVTALKEAIAPVRGAIATLNESDPAVAQLADADAALGGVLGFLSIVQRLDPAAAGGQQLGAVFDALKALGVPRAGEVATPLLDLLQPVIAQLHARRPLDGRFVFDLLRGLHVEDVLVALGFAESEDAVCRVATSAQCWVARLVRIVQDSLQYEGDHLRVDGSTMAERLGRLGDDFRTRHTGGWYLHLTIGTGLIYSVSPPVYGSTTIPASGTTPARTVPTLTDGESRAVPSVSEQVGVGYAFPSCGDVATFKLAVFASGILYRLVLDSQESEAVLFGGLAGLDLYGLLELYVAPTLLVYPPRDGFTTQTNFGLQLGVQVPLGDYLTRR